MPTYIILGKWTQQGIENVKDTLNRAGQVQQLAEQMGGRFNLYWTQGEYDFVGIADFPDEESVNAFALAAGSRGSVRTQMLRAYSAEEMERILSRLP